MDKIKSTEVSCWQKIISIVGKWSTPSKMLLCVILPASIILIIDMLSSGAHHIFFLNITGLDNFGEAESYTNARRNLYIIFFATIAALLAIWARMTAHEQFELSKGINRDKRFSQAADMLKEENNTASYTGALQILGELITEDPKANHFRCMEVICNWLQIVSSDAINTDKDAKYKIPDKVIRMACKILKDKLDYQQINLDELYIEKYNLIQWPEIREVNFSRQNFEGINFKNANLYKANFERSNLRGANLKYADLTRVNFENADLTDVDMKSAQGLKINQIISANWYYKEGSIGPPKLPASLAKNAIVKEWLKKS